MVFYSLQKSQTILTSLQGRSSYIGGVFFICIFLIFSSLAQASEIYQKPTDFLQEVFTEEIPQEKFIWLEESDHLKIQDLTGNKYDFFRVRYWGNLEKKVIILNDIGKYKPITVGFILEEDKIEEIKVLIYREDHGWEVKYPFFTNQFKELSLEKGRLNKKIDSIAGATLSVDALKRMATISLYLNKKINEENNL